ncbi:MAG: hypothetical protein HY925_11105 [Elusimicrobia bacterium]|nr:hypothetical protein [Elusimicrobiota bacterium]
MKVRVPREVPVMFAFDAAESRADGWGRWTRLHPRGGRVSTRFRLEPGDRVFVSFEAAGEAFDEVLAKVERAGRDADGYFEADVRLEDEVNVHRLGAALRGLVTRAGK